MLDSDRKNRQVRDWLLQYVANLLGKPSNKIITDKPLSSLGLSSIEGITLSNKLGEWLNIELPATLMWDFPTIDRIAAYLDSGLSPSKRLAEEDESHPAPDPIACIGIGCRFPGAHGPEAFWKLLTDGVDAVTTVPPERWDVDAFYSPDRSVPGKMVSRYGGFLDNLDQFDAQFFRMSRREACQLDPRQRLLLEVAWEALEDAGIPPSQLSGTDAGVFIATLGANYGATLFTHYLNCIDAYAGSGNGESVTANRISYFFDLHGPSIAIDTACAGSLVAMHLACGSLSQGEATLALVGGVNVILRPDDSIFFSKTGALAADGRCKAFDHRADGIVRSEGAGIVVLRPLSEALARGNRIYAVIRGSAVNHDGATNGLMSPNSSAQEKLLRDAYRRARVRPADVQYIEAHGTGTEIGDPIEVNTLGAVLANGRIAGFDCALGSVKSNIGHTEAAAGVAGLIKVALAMRHRKLPPTIHFEKSNPLIQFDHLPLSVQNRLGPWPDESRPLLAGVSALGFAGANAHVVLEEAPRQEAFCDPILPEHKPLILPISAHSDEALYELAGAYAEKIRCLKDGSSLSDICQAAAHQRDHLARRCAVISASCDEACRLLEALQAGKPRTDVQEPGEFDGDARLALVFSGQGSHWPHMGAGLLRSEPLFRRTIEQCDRLIADLAGWSLLTVLEDPERESRLNETAVTQLAIFAIQIGIAVLLRQWGFVPDAVVGQSLGEVAAAHVAGVLTLEEAVRVVYHRSRLMQRVAGQGKTAVVAIGEDELGPIIRASGKKLSYAGCNSPGTSVISGDSAALRDLVEELTSREVFARILPGVDVAFHSSEMEPLREELVRELSGITPRVNRVPLYTALAGGRTEGHAFGPAYWGRNLREPFHFNRAIMRMVELGCNTFIEISPHPVLCGSVRECLIHQGNKGVVVPSLRRNADERRCLLNVVGLLYAHGFQVDWRALYPGRVRHVSLPTMAWQRQRYWYDQLAHAEMPSGFDPRTGRPFNSVLRPNGHPLIGEQVALANIPGENVWIHELGASFPPYLAEHRVTGTAVLPAAAYVEIAAAVMKQMFGAHTATIENLEIESPLVLRDGTSRKIQVTASSMQDNAFKLQVFSMNTGGGNADGNWIRHAAAILLPPGDAGATTSQETAAEVRSRCTEVIEAHHHFTAMSAEGLQYGPCFQGLKGIWRGDGEALGRLELPESLGGDLRDYTIHPALLDAAIQLVRHTSPRGGDARLPAGLGRTVIIRPAEQPNLWCHAIVKDKNRTHEDDIKVDLRLFDDHGLPVLFIESVRLRRFEIASRPTLNLDDWFFQIEWPLQPMTTPTVPLATAAHCDEGFIAELEHQIATWSKENELEHYARQWLLYDRLCAAYVEQALLDMGWTPAIGEQATTGELSARLKIAFRHKRFFERLLAIMAEDGILQRVGQHWQVRRELRAHREGALRSEIADLFPASVAELALVTRSGESLPAVLRGQREALEVLYPNQEDQMLQRLYEDSVFMRVYNAIIAESVAVAVAASQRGEEAIRIIEIGAGTGASTQHVLQRLPSRGVKYTVTDISRLLIEHAKRRFAGDGRVAYQELDIEVAPENQGFERGHYDIVIAANVLHATRDLRESLKHARRLLKPGGTLVLLEGPGPQRWLDLIVGGTEGWWRFSDSDLRSSYPLVSCDQWKTLLAESGFKDIAAFMDPSEAPPQFVILGRRPADLTGPQEVRQKRAGSVQRQKAWILLADRGGVADDLAILLRDRGERCVQVTICSDGRKNVDGEVRVDPAHGEDLAHALEQLISRETASMIGVVHMWGLDLPPGDRVAAADLNTMENLCGSIISMVQTASEAGSEAEFRMWLVTRGCQPAGETKRPLSIAQVPLWGLFRALSAELADWCGALIDLDPERSQHDASQVLGELEASDGEDQIAWRHNQRYAARLKRRRDLPTIRKRIRFDDNASYLITGGLSGIGLCVAQWMVQRGARHLALVTRKPLPPREKWEEMDASDPLAERIIAVKQIEGQGANVRVLAVDVGNEAAFAAEIQAFEQEGWPPIRGVVHSAGLLDDRLLVNMDMDVFTRVARPKIRGGWLLHRYFRDKALDFFLLFSSGTSLVGWTMGQGNYAAGNAFLDALAHHRFAMGLPATCINWGVWSEFGIIARLNRQEQLASTGLMGISAEEGLLAMERILRSDAVQLGAIPLDWNAWRRASPTAARHPFFSEIGPATFENAIDQMSGPLDQEFFCKLAVAEDPERTALLETFLSDIVAQVMQLDPDDLDRRKPLNEFGLDSIMAVELKHHIDTKLGVATSVVEMLKGASVASVARLIAGEIGRPLEAFGEIVSGVEQLSAEEVSAALRQEV